MIAKKCLFLISLFLSNALSFELACAEDVSTRSVYKQFSPTLPDRWRTPTAELSELPPEQFPTDEEWWSSFNDPHLMNYITKALAANPTYEIAKARVEGARAVARQALAREFPTVGVSPAFTRQRNSENLIAFPLSQANQSGPRLFRPGDTVNIFNVPLQVNYETDLFLKKRWQTKVQDMKVRAEMWNERSSRITLLTEVATSYFNLAFYRERLKVGTELVDAARNIAELYTSLNQAGLLDSVRLDDALVQLAKAEQQQSENQRLLAIAEDQLRFLLGFSVSSDEVVQTNSLDLQNLPKAISTGIPSQLLLRRPDLLASEAELKAARLNVSVARRAFLPSFNLALQSGFSSINLGNLFNPESFLIAFTAGATQSLFAGGARVADLKLANAQQRVAAAEYGRSVLLALRESEDAIASFVEHKTQLSIQQDICERSQQDYELVQQQYEVGLIPLQDSLKLKIEMLQQTNEYNSRLAGLFGDSVSIYKALGGGY